MTPALGAPQLPAVVDHCALDLLQRSTSHTRLCKRKRSEARRHLAMSGGGAKQVGEAIFKHIARRRAPSLFKKMMRSLDSGEYHVPKSFQVMSRCAGRILSSCCAAAATSHHHADGACRAWRRSAQVPFGRAQAAPRAAAPRAAAREPHDRVLAAGFPRGGVCAEEPRHGQERARCCVEGASIAKRVSACAAHCAGQAGARGPVISQAPAGPAASVAPLETRAAGAKAGRPQPGGAGGSGGCGTVKIRAGGGAQVTHPGAGQVCAFVCTSGPGTLVLEGSRQHATRARHGCVRAGAPTCPAGTWASCRRRRRYSCAPRLTRWRAKGGRGRRPRRRAARARRDDGRLCLLLHSAATIRRGVLTGQGAQAARRDGPGGFGQRWPGRLLRGLLWWCESCARGAVRAVLALIPGA